MRKLFALALAAAALPSSALAHHGGPADVAAGIGAAAVVLAIVAGLLAFRAWRRRAGADGAAEDLAAAMRPSIRR